MRGQVLGVDPVSREGQISGDDGSRYSFRDQDWCDPAEPHVGALVDFEAEGRRALKIFHQPQHAPAVQQAIAAAALAPSDRNKYIAALLAFLLGPLAIHRFYLGRNGSAVVMLLLSLTVVGLIVTYPWAFIDMVRYLMMSDREFALRYDRS